MVDVSAKPETDRRAEAEAVVTFPEEAWSKLAKDGFTTKKGVFGAFRNGKNLAKSRKSRRSNRSRKSRK